MAKWADYLISQVSYDQNHIITKAKQHRDIGNEMGDGEIVDRDVIAGNLGHGVKYMTVYGDLGKIRMGKNVRYFRAYEGHYIRTDGNKVMSDNLDDIPNLNGTEQEEKPALVETKPKPNAEAKPLSALSSAFFSEHLEAEVAPEVAEVAPEVAEVAPEVAEVAPEVAEVAPEVAEVAPEVAEVAPEVAEVAPEVAPEVAEVAPEPAEVAPEKTIMKTKSFVKKKSSAKKKPSRKKSSAKKKPSRKKSSAKKKPSRKKSSAKKKPSRKKSSAKKKPSRKKSSAKKKPSRKKRRR